MRVPLKDNVEGLLSVLRTITEDSNQQAGRWKGIIPELCGFYDGRVGMAAFVIECLEKYIEQDTEKESLC